MQYYPVPNYISLVGKKLILLQILQNNLALRKTPKCMGEAAS